MSLLTRENSYVIVGKMDLHEPISLTSDGTVITLPLINLLRVTFIKFIPFIVEYQQETGQSDVAGLIGWMKEKLEMKGKNVLV